jgi:c-di-GMP-binding flagellar brake protein YcgR
MVEKRRFVRVDVPIRVWYRLKEKGVAKSEAISKNIGGGGICIHVSHTFAAGSLLKLTLGILGVSEPIETEAEVLWVEKREKGDEGFRTDYEAGLKFTSLSNVDRASIINFICESVKKRKEVRIPSTNLP